MTTSRELIQTSGQLGQWKDEGSDSGSVRSSGALGRLLHPLASQSLCHLHSSSSSFFLAVPLAFRSSRARDRTPATAVTMLDP